VNVKQMQNRITELDNKKRTRTETDELGDLIMNYPSNRDMSISDSALSDAWPPHNRKGKNFADSINIW
jgi:hypothetical protein